MKRSHLAAIDKARAEISRPIGVFDSGVGGLTVLTALRKRLMHRDFIYVADTARLPYGRKPAEMVRSFARGIATFLVRLQVEAIVIACNTASAVALPQLAEETAIPTWGVIEPGVEAARRQTQSGHVGVIGTKGTIASGEYQRRIEVLGLSVWAQACPLFVHLVEEDMSRSAEAQMLAHHYLSCRPQIDTLILGCTHYPLLRHAIQAAVGESVALVSSADATAEVVGNAYDGDGAGSGRTGHILHCVTGDTIAYQHTAEVIGGVSGHVLPLDVAALCSAS